MTLIVDAGALHAQADADDDAHKAVIGLLKAERGPIVTSELAVAEADYLILDRLGVDVEIDFLTDLVEGRSPSSASATRTWRTHGAWSNATATCAWDSPMRRSWCSLLVTGPSVC